MFSWLKSLASYLSGAEGGRPSHPHAAQHHTRASYDAAVTTDENSRHWVYADALSARTANSPAVRKVLRERARYEIANNSYARGIVRTLAVSLVGEGPRLQMQTADQSLNRSIEDRWSPWAKLIRLADKLRTLKQAKTGDGEGFGLLISNPLLASAVQLDLRLVECDRFATPFRNPLDYLVDDGLRFDEYGNIVEYTMLVSHPGDYYPHALEHVTLSPEHVIHWFRKDRPEQVRGVSELTPAIPLFGQLRRFTLATLTAAETAAMFAAVLETAAPADSDGAQPDPFETLEIERGLMTQLPSGFKMSQFKAEHPTSTYEIFVWCIMREICRCLDIPLNVALGDSSKSNFSSARLDYLTYRDAVAVEREDCEREVLEPILSAWLREASRIPGYLSPGLPGTLSLPHTWHWPAWAATDPKTEAEADEIRLRSGAATLAEITAGQGADWREVIRQQVREEIFRDQVRKELGATTGPAEVIP